MLMIQRNRNGPWFWGHPLDLFREDFSRLFSWSMDGDTEPPTDLYPIDISENDKHIQVEAEVPGFKADEIDVSLEKGVLRIAAEHKSEGASKDKKCKTHLAERCFTRVARTLQLPDSVDENKVDAKLNNGVLILTLSKREQVKPKKIEVR